MTNQSKKKAELLKILRDAECDGQELASKGREITKQGQSMSDFARYNSEFVELIPDDSFFSQKDWDDRISIWTKTHEDATVVKKGLEGFEPLVFAADSTAISSVSIISSETISALPSRVQASAWPIVEKLNQRLEQSNLIKEIEDEIKRLNLTTSYKGNASVMSLLMQAAQAFKAPSVEGVAPSAVLIPLREAINRIIADLLPKRPKQEKTKGDRGKIQSICTQCHRAGVDAIQIDNLAEEAERLKDILSQGKQGLLTREQVRERLNRGLLFLRAFLRILKLPSK